MKNIKIMVTSDSDLPLDVADQYGIGIIPATIIIDGTAYLNDVDLSLSRFYEIIDTLDTIPTTSHPNIELYKEYLSRYEDCDTIIVIQISTLIASAYNTLCIAANELKEQGFKAKIIPYDSRMFSWGMGMMTIEAAKMANDGKSVGEIIAHLDYLRNNKIGVYSVIKSLHNVRASGRTGDIRVLAADILGVKPIITQRDGTVKDIKIARSFEKGIDELYAIYRIRAKKGGDVFIGHSNNIQTADGLAARLREIDPKANVSVVWLGMNVAVHTGTGVVGVCFLEE